MELGNAIALSTLIVTVGALLLRYSLTSNNRYLRKDDHDKLCMMIQKGIEDKFTMILDEIKEIKKALSHK